MGLLRLVKGIGIGAGLMYFLDPDLGQRRRALVRDKVVGAVQQFRDETEGLVADVSRALGASAGENRSPAWVPTARLAASLTGGVLMARCLRNPTALNMLLGTLGCGLFLRAMSPECTPASDAAHGTEVPAGAGPQPAAALST